MTNGYNTPIGVPIGLPSILSLGLPPLINPFPTLNLDFINNPQFDSRITFSRGSQATLFDSTGTLVYAKHNLLVRSQDFSTGWTLSQSTLTAASGIAPDGTNTAGKLILNNGSTVSSSRAAYQSIAGITGVHTVSIFAKAAEFNVLRISGLSAANTTLTGPDFTLSGAGSVGALNSATSASITPVGNNWYRCVATFDFLTGVTSARPYYASVQATGDGTSGILIWGAQLNLPNMEGGVTSSLTTYYPTTTAAYYAPRFDYNPSTLQPRGLLIEEQRTNGIRNNTMQGAVAGTPGTLPTNWTSAATVALTQQIVGVGTENGITYLDFRLSGTPSGDGVFDLNFEASTQVAASNGQTWTNSSYVRLVGGSVTNVDCKMLLRGRGSGGAAIAGQAVETSFVPTSAALSTQRAFATFTMSSASVLFALPSIRFSYTNGNSFDITLRIGLPQLEQGAFATSVIPTTTTALTRNADVASMTGTNFSSWYNQTEGSLLVNSVLSGSSTNRDLISISDGSANNAISVRWASGSQAQFSVAVSGSGQVNIAPAGYSTLGQLYRRAVAYKVDNFQQVIDGASVGTDALGLVPTVDRMFIGASTTGSTTFNGYVQRVSYYPVRLAGSTLQALTA